MNMPWRSRPRSRGGHSRGQSMVEFALVAPLPFLMVFGTFEFARFIFFYELLNNAAREGARYAIVHGSRSDCPSGPPRRVRPTPATLPATT
ncbi:hypothetical protein BH23CHL8_BH23CHL8_14650 [soil metagenome]